MADHQMLSRDDESIIFRCEYGIFPKGMVLMFFLDVPFMPARCHSILWLPCISQSSTSHSVLTKNRSYRFHSGRSSSLISARSGAGCKGPDVLRPTLHLLRIIRCLPASKGLRTKSALPIISADGALLSARYRNSVLGED